MLFALHFDSLGMKPLEKKDLTAKSIKDLVALRNSLRKELYDLRLKNSLRSLTQTHLITLAKRNIAKVNTFLTQKTHLAALQK